MYIKIDDFNLYYEKYGNKAQTIVILPGWGDNRLTFTYLINYLKDYFTIYILDYPGFGNSSFPNHDLTIYDYASLIKNFLEKLAITNPILIGHSFGGRIIILLTTLYNLPIKKLLLIDIAGMKKKKDFKLFLKQTFYKCLKKLSYIFPQPLKTNYLNYLFKHFASKDYQQLPVNMQKTFQNVVREDLSCYLAKITLETLILWGEFDTITPYQDALKLNKLLCNSTLIKITNTSHFPYLEKKYLVSKIIFEYLKKDII